MSLRCSATHPPVSITAARAVSVPSAIQSLRNGSLLCCRIARRQECHTPEAGTRVTSGHGWRRNYEPTTLDRLASLDTRVRHARRERADMKQPETQYARSGDVSIAYQVFG